MAAKKGKKAGGKVRDLPAKAVSSKQAKATRGGVAAGLFKPLSPKLEVPNASVKKLFTC